MKGSRHGRVLSIIALVSTGAGWASAAPAIADVEPNNVISQAEGPVAGGAPVTGTLSTPDDVDYYVFYGASQQQIHLTSDDLTNDPGASCLSAGLEDTNGRGLASNYTTPPGTNRFFVHIEYRNGFGCKNPESYRFEIDPGSGVTTGAPLDRVLTQTGEPNETPGQASGPLRANVNYVGAHETTNDEDWFYFFVPAGTHQLDLSTTAPARNSYSCDATVALFGSPSSSGSIGSATADWATFSHVTQTLTGPSRHYIRAGVEDTDCLGARWQFRIETPGAVTAANPIPPPPPAPPPVVTPIRYATAVTLRRRKARYSGRVSTAAECRVGRRVVLRRAGSGLRSFGVGVTRSNGTFTIRRSRRLRGRVHAVVVAARAAPTVLCSSGRSRRIRG